MHSEDTSKPWHKSMAHNLHGHIFQAGSLIFFKHVPSHSYLSFVPSSPFPTFGAEEKPTREKQQSHGYKT